VKDGLAVRRQCCVDPTGTACGGRFARARRAFRWRSKCRCTRKAAPVRAQNVGKNQRWNAPKPRPGRESDAKGAQIADFHAGSGAARCNSSKPLSRLGLRWAIIASAAREAAARRSMQCGSALLRSGNSQVVAARRRRARTYNRRVRAVRVNL